MEHVLKWIVVVHLSLKTFVEILMVFVVKIDGMIVKGKGQVR